MDEALYTVGSPTLPEYTSTRLARRYSHVATHTYGLRETKYVDGPGIQHPHSLVTILRSEYATVHELRSRGSVQVTKREEAARLGDLWV